ncbi:hypothetical protein L1049_024825 [Liquidambar formosana]|uniref:Calcium-transporting P-type ATPase N-terminal autoinhibitory domain-containing protein n=1 Tax=Liquidambar formosana TaxID=63359 RepID=A0AAP0RWC5_LIQFO
MENRFVNEKFEGVKPKGSSEEALKKWREHCFIVKNPKRRFRFTANFVKRAQAADMLKTFKEEA